MPPQSKLDAPQDTVAVKLKDILHEDTDDEESVPMPMTLDLEFSDRDMNDDPEEEEEPQNTESFNLFGVATTVRLESEEPEDERVYRKRPDSYYFASFDDAQRRQFESVSVAGEDILKSVRYVSKPWRVIDISRLQEQAKRDRQRARRRPGQKSRIARRKVKERLGLTTVVKNQEKYGPERVYSNSKLKTTTKKKKGVSGQGGHPRKGVSGQGGHPRKGQKKA